MLSRYFGGRCPGMRWWAVFSNRRRAGAGLPQRRKDSGSLMRFNNALSETGMSRGEGIRWRSIGCFTAVYCVSQNHSRDVVTSKPTIVNIISLVNHGFHDRLEKKFINTAPTARTKASLQELVTLGGKCLSPFGTKSELAPVPATPQGSSR